MTVQAPDMTALRRSSIESMATAALPAPPRQPFADIRVKLGEHPLSEDPAVLPGTLIDAIVERLLRGDGCLGAGVAVVTGVSGVFGLDDARLFHEALFLAVWDSFRRRAIPEPSTAGYRVKVKTTADGVIPLELYGSNWSFKQLHMDRDALLFSHLYGPLSGFSGGSLVLVDIRELIRHRHLGFDELFEFSDEPTEGRKPVLRDCWTDAAVAEYGIDLGPMGPDEILFINNCPDAGILHGVTPVAVTDPSAFVREFHRCSVKDARCR